MNIIGYKTFATEDDFIKWQKSEGKPIVQVMPFINSFAQEPNKEEFCADTKCGVFVTYLAENRNT